MEQKSIPKWKDKTLIEKLLKISMVIVFFAILVVAIMQLTGIWGNNINVYEPLMGVFMILNGLNSYKYNKFAALFSFGAAIYIFVIAFIIIFI